MNLVVGILTVVAITAVAITAMLLVRRRAPEGGYFADGDRASGVFGVLATGFSVLLGFLIFLTFESYDSSRSGAEEEAIAVIQQLETAQLMASPEREELSGMLVCYARYVVGTEWQQMEDGTLGDQLNPWGVAMFQTIRTVSPQTVAEETAYATWLEQTSAREVARNARIHGADGIIPTPLWIGLFLISAVVFVYMLCFADSGERRFIQAVLMGSVAVVITTMLLLLKLLDEPYHPGVGALQPAAMERTLTFVDQAREQAGLEFAIPCDESGLAP